MANSLIKQQYFDWLYNLIDDGRKKHKKLCTEFYNREFEWFIPNDDNRCEDGLNLREQFLESGKYSTDENSKEFRDFALGRASVLEVLIALAQRIDFLMFDLNPGKARTSKWFFEMVANMGLMGCMDDRVSHGDILQIHQAIDRVIDRKYDFRGHGSLFPVRRTLGKDMSKTEIWYQMMAYLDENYAR